MTSPVPLAIPGELTAIQPATLAACQEQPVPLVSTPTLLEPPADAKLALD